MFIYMFPFFLSWSLRNASLHIITPLFVFHRPQRVKPVLHKLNVISNLFLVRCDEIFIVTVSLFLSKGVSASNWLEIYYVFFFLFLIISLSAIYFDEMFFLLTWIYILIPESNIVAVSAAWNIYSLDLASSWVPAMFVAFISHRLLLSPFVIFFFFFISLSMFVPGGSAWKTDLSAARTRCLCAAC